MISNQALEKARTVAPGYDVYALKGDYLAFWDDKGQQPLKNADAAFLGRSEEHTSELQSLMRISYAVFCLKKKNTQSQLQQTTHNETMIKTSNDIDNDRESTP